MKQRLLTCCCAVLCGVLQTANGFEPFAAGDGVLSVGPAGREAYSLPNVISPGSADSGLRSPQASSLRAFELPELTVPFDPFWGDWVARRSQVQEPRMAVVAASFFGCDSVAGNTSSRTCFTNSYFNVRRTCVGDACVRDVEYVHKFSRRTNEEKSILAANASPHDWFFSSRGMDEGLADGFFKNAPETKTFHEIMKPARWRVQPPDMVGFTFVFGKVNNEMLETASNKQTPEVALLESSNENEKALEWNSRIRMRDVSFYVEPDLQYILFNPTGINRFSNAFLIGCQTGISF